MAKVRVDNVNKVYPNGFHAVQNAHFDIEDGEFIVLVGPSGCGKSTLLRMFAGLEDISSGTISIDGDVVNAVDPAKRNIAMVFQNYALYPHMSVFKNMAYGLKRRKIPAQEIDKIVRQAAELLDLTPLLERKPSQLSGGQRQRVAMGRAIVRSPRLFLFDEPLSNLDAKLRGQMRVEIRKLQRELGVTSVYVTHDQVEAMTMADRIVVLNGGLIEQIGTPDEVYHRPASKFVASFMGAPPMNFLPAQGNGNGRLIVDGVGELASPVNGLSDKVELGMRPESVAISATDGPFTAPFALDFIEELGAVRLLHGQLGPHRFIVHTPYETVLPDGPIHLELRPETMNLFECESGRRL